VGALERRRREYAVTAYAELCGASKTFGRVEALTDVDFRIDGGEVVALLGRNGAGKTTTIQLLLGLRQPDRGRAALFGADPSRPASRRHCGAMPQEIGLPETLRVREIVDFVRAHFPRPLSLKELIDRFGLTELAMRQAGGLSGGERRRVGVALAFAGDPELVFLDEPSSSLDVESKHALWDVIRSFAAVGRGIVLTTHDLGEAQALATRVVVLDHGRVAVEGPVNEIAARGRLVEIRLRRQRLPQPRTAESLERDEEALVLWTKDEDALLRELVSLNANLRGIEISRPGLEQLLQGAGR
jgi:ABC-2 type transport system ATP-binding protein